jgi:hypothetical protein
VLRTTRRLVPGRGVSAAAEDTFVGPAAADDDEGEDEDDDEDESEDDDGAGNRRFAFGRDDCCNDDEDVDSWESEGDEERGGCSSSTELARSHSS